jgi:metal-responsive CopG/Arc/MetJ family transcriptional regulator
MRASRSHDKDRNQEPPTIRASISFPSDLYSSLEALAQKKKVSLAWVVRDAVERYVVQERPTKTRTLL